VDTAHAVLEKHCFVATIAPSKEARSKVEYKLPDGKVVDIGAIRCVDTEAFFTGALSSKQRVEPVQEFLAKRLSKINVQASKDTLGPLVDAMRKVALDGQAATGAALASATNISTDLKAAYDSASSRNLNINLESEIKMMKSTCVLAGGMTMLPNFVDRFASEIGKVCSGMKIMTDSCPRHFTAWVGGSIVGSLQSFHPMCVSRKRYEEIGAVAATRELMKLLS